MSNRGIEEIPEKKVNLLNMSERQALLYFQHGGGEEDRQKEKCNALLDYHQYFLYKKAKLQSQIDKAKLAERKKLKKQSLKEFTLIKKNIYNGRDKYVLSDDQAYVCSCFPRKYTQSEANKIIESGYENKTEEELFGCGRSCLNKMVYWECVKHLCPCGASCRNRKFQNHEYAEVYPIKTKDRGYGLCAGTFLPKGSFVIQYIGEVYSIDSPYGQKKLQEYKNSTCTYLMSLTKNEVVDPTSKGNFARFINHSCEPNCETQKWHVSGEICVGIFTLRDIQEDEELTFNYGFDIAKTVYQKCLCGAPTCRGYLGIVTNDNPKKSLSSVNCEACKQHCKGSDCILICETCKKIYHKQCAKKGRGNNKNFTCYHCLKKDMIKQQVVEPSKEKIIKIEEEPIYDEYYEVGDEELGKIRKNLKELMNCGARLFWDFQQQNSILGTTNKLEIKITGTPTQVENVKNMIKQLKETKNDTNNTFIVKIQVPKIYVRKIIGHQNRNLNSYKSKYNVEVEYDMSLITDEIFPIQESTFIQIKGKENNVKAVENDIKGYLYNLKVLTIFLMPTDYQYIRANICDLKTKIDPADVRLRKREYKGERELKHPFYFIPNNNKDIVIIGFDGEIKKGEKRIKEQILRQNSLLYNYSLSFLFSNYFGKQLNTFLNENKNHIRDKKLYIDVVKPESPRKHLSVYVEGKWKDVIDFKNYIWVELKDLSAPDYFSNVNLRKHNVTGFEQYAFNQEHKLTSKGIKAFVIEQNSQIKNWDTISTDVSVILDKKLYEREKSLALGSNNNSTLESQKGKNDTPAIIKNFVSNCDKETKINYLLAFEPGSYSSIFNLTQGELANDLLSTFTEVYDNYKDTKAKETNSNMSETKEVFGSSSYVPNEIGSECGDIVMKEEGTDMNNGSEIKELKQNITEEDNKKEELKTPKEEPEHDEPCPSTVDVNNSENKEKKEQRENTITILTNNQMIPKEIEKSQNNHNITIPSLPKNNPLSSISQLMPTITSNKIESIANRQEQDGINNISYNFSNINHMNININIHDSKTFLNNEQQTTPSLAYSHHEQNLHNHPPIIPQKGNMIDNMDNTDSKILQHKTKRSKSRNSSSSLGNSKRHIHRHYRPSNNKYIFPESNTRKHKESTNHMRGNSNNYRSGPTGYDNNNGYYSRSSSSHSSSKYNNNSSERYGNKYGYPSTNPPSSVYYNMSDGYNYKKYSSTSTNPYKTSSYRESTKRHYEDNRYNSRKKGYYYSKNGYGRKYKNRSHSRSKSRSFERRYNTYSLKPENDIRKDDKSNSNNNMGNIIR